MMKIKGHTLAMDTDSEMYLSKTIIAYTTVTVVVWGCAVDQGGPRTLSIHLNHAHQRPGRVVQPALH